MIVEKIESDRLQFVTLDPDNVSPRYLLWLQDPEVVRYLESRLAEHSESALRNYILENNGSSSALLLGIFEKETGAHIGNVRISEISWQHGHAEIGLLIGEKDRWGKGYAKEAIASLTAYAFETLKLRKLVAGCYVSNAGSVQAFKRANFTQVGRLQAHWDLGGRFDDQVLLERNAPMSVLQRDARLSELQRATVPERINAIQRALGEPRYSQGPSMFLRLLLPTDIDDRYVSWFADGTVVSFLESRNVTRENSTAYLNHGLSSGEYVMCAVCDRATGKHIGNLKLGPIVWTHGTSDLVTVVGDRSYWGRGVATEAIQLGSRLMLEGIGLRKLHGTIYASNAGSVKAYTRAGWTVEGRLKDHVIHEGEPMDVVLVSCWRTDLK